MEKIHKKMESEGTTIRYIVLMFLGAGINFTVGFVVMFSGITALIQSPVQTLTSTLPQTVSLLVTCYFVIGIIYSTSASLSFYPKRIVSPLYVQITTAAFFPILVAFIIVTVPLNPPIDFLTGAIGTFFLFLFSLVMFFVAGIGQAIVVR